MGCLNNVIGISRKCTTDVPSSGQFIEDLEGIELDFANAVAKKDQESGIEMIEKKIDRAELVIKNDINRHLSNIIRQDSLLEFETAGFLLDNLQPVASEAFKKGLRLEVDQGGYRSLHIHSIGLWLDAAIGTNIELFDLLTGKVIDTFAITTVADELTTIIVDRTYLSNSQKVNYAFLYDASLAGTFKTSLNGDRECCRKTGDNSIHNAFTITQGIKILDASPKISNNLVSGDGSEGMVLNYSLKCAVDNFLCHNSDSFALALLYKTAELLVKEAVFSPRQNYITLSMHDLNKDLEEDYGNLYRDAIKNVTTNMRIPSDRKCFHCAPPIKKQLELPG